MSEALAGMPPVPDPAGRGGTRAALDRVLAALGRGDLSPPGGSSSDRLMARCPVHEDHSPSLSVRWVRGQRGGMVLLHCHGCAAPAADITQALGLDMADLFDEPLPPRQDPQVPRAGRSVPQRQGGARRGRLGRLPRPIAVAWAPATPAQHAWKEMERYPYQDAQGRLVQEVIRKECATCGPPHKKFEQKFVRTDGETTKPDGFTPVLYRLPQVIAAIAEGRAVWLLEGEKDVHTAESLGLVATTNAQGGRGFPAELAEVFRGATVHVVLDRDDTGWDRGVGLHALLTAVDAAVQLLLPAPAAAKADFTDHVTALRAAAAAPHPAPDPPEDPAEGSGGARPDGAAVARCPPTPEEAFAGGGLGGLLRVHVEEVRAWALAGAAAAKHRAVEQTLAETRAHAAAGNAAAAAKKPAAAAESDRLARRWAVESEIRWETLRDAVDDVRRQAARTGTEWVGEAVDAAQEQLRQATTAARAAHETVGLALPPALQPPRPDLPDPPGDAGRAADGPDGPAGSAPEAGGAGKVGTHWIRVDEPSSRPGVAVSQPVFRIVDGRIVQVDRRDAAGRRRGPDREEGGEEEVFKLILGLDVRIAEMEYLEDADTVDVDSPRLRGRQSREGQAALNPPGPQVLSAVVLAYTHPATGEMMHMRVAAEDYRDCGWLESLPGPPDYDPKPAGLATVRRAIKAVSGGIRTTVRYRSTGWRHDAGGWFFVHAGGAITGQGCRSVPVLLNGPLTRYDLPDPCTDPGRLREAFLEHSGGLLGRMPGRVAAPLLGHIYRSALGPNPWVLGLVGSPGTFKTSVASIGMHHWGELWDRRKPATSMSGNGDTLNALRIKLNCAKDALYWADDVAPTKDWAAAQKLLEEFARLVHNGEQRSRSTRDGLGVLEGTPPRSSAIITSEVMPRPGSGAQRMLIVPLQAEEIALEDLIALDAEESRHGRALLMASLLRWLAADLEAVRERCLAEAIRYAAGLRGDGEAVRQAEAVGHTWAGWICVTDFLLEVGAIEAGERDRLLARVDAGLRDTLVAGADPDLPTRTGARVRELLVHALRSGAAFAEDVRTGEAPPWPLAGRLGWRRTPIGEDPDGHVRYRTEPKGIRFGYVLHDPDLKDGPAQLLVDSTALEQVLKATAMSMADAPQIDRGTALRALLEEGVLIAEQRTGRTPRYTVQRTLHCEDRRRCRVTALRLAELLGDGPEPDEQPAADAGTEPLGDGDTGTGRPCPAGEGAGGGFLDLFTPAASPAAVDDSQHPRLGSLPPPAGLTSPTNAQQEPCMGQPFPDADGTLVAGQMIDPPGVCLACGRRCAMTYQGLVLHVPCWMASTAASRAEAARAGTAPAAPEPAAVPVPRGAPAPTSTPAAAPAPAPATVEPPPAAPAATPPPARHVRRVTPPAGKAFRAAAAVLHTDGVWLPDGTLVSLPEDLTHVGHIAELVDRLELGTRVTPWHADPGQIWVTPQALAGLGIDPDGLPTDPGKRRDAIRDLTRGSALVTGAIEQGWQLGGGKDCLSAWTRVWHGTARGVWVALIPAMNTGPLDLPVLGGDPDPATLARRLGLFAGALRAPWAVSAGTTGLELMKTLRAKDKEKLFTPHPPIPPAEINTLEQDLNWSRIPSEQEQRDNRYVHAYDRGGSYIAGVAGLELGIGAPTHHPQGRPFDPKLPGYWQIEVPAAGDLRMPHPLNPRGGLPARPVWVTTPGLQLAYELGYEEPIMAAWTWPEHGRVLDPWYERIRDARTELDRDDADAQAARDQLKVVYTRTIGLLGSEEWMRGKPGYAPDRRHHIVAKARANILRRIVRIGTEQDRWPVAVTADTLLYASDDPDPVTAWPGNPAQLGRGFGQYKPEASGLLADQLKHLTGRDYRGKEKLDHHWQPHEHPTDVAETTEADVALAGVSP